MEAPSQVAPDLVFDAAKRFGLRRFGAGRELLRLELSHSEAQYRLAQFDGNRAAAARCMQAVLFNRALVECEARLYFLADGVNVVVGEDADEETWSRLFQANLDCIFQIEGEFAAPEPLRVI